MLVLFTVTNILGCIFQLFEFVIKIIVMFVSDDIMETIIKQEEDRTRSICPEQNNELTSLLLPFYKNPKRSGDVLELLDSL